MTSIGIAKLPFFIIGAWAGKQATEGRKLNWLWIWILTLLLVMLYVFPINTWLNVREWLFRILGIILCCYALKLTSRLSGLHGILRWFGKYTLEIYIIHLLFKGALNTVIANVNNQTLVAIGGALLLCVPIHYIGNKIVVSRA